MQEARSQLMIEQHPLVSSNKVSIEETALQSIDVLEILRTWGNFEAVQSAFI